MAFPQKASPLPLSPSSPGSGSRVASIYELLEMIILDLPLRELLHLRAVGRSFQRVVDTSEHIGLRFSLPFSSLKLRVGDYVRHPLLPREVDVWAGKTRKSHVNGAEGGGGGGQGGGYVTCRFVLKQNANFDWSAPASWRNFYACGPRARSMRAWTGCSKVFGRRNTGEYRFYQSSRGLTLGQLADAACAMKTDAQVDDAIVHFETDLDDDGNDVPNEACSQYTKYWV